MSNQTIDNLQFVSEIRNKMSQEKLMLSYRGRISQEIVVALLNLTEVKLNQAEQDGTARSRVFSVLIECLQNIAQHSEKDFQSDSSMFMIGQSDKEYSIYSGNIVKNESRVDELRSKISKLNSMSETELKEFQKFWMKNETLSPKNGFGLGLIHIARKTGNPLECDFKQIDNEHFFFSLKTKIDR